MLFFGDDYSVRLAKPCERKSEGPENNAVVSRKGSNVHMFTFGLFIILHFEDMKSR